jgi:hypothetical protein
VPGTTLAIAVTIVLTMAPPSPIAGPRLRVAGDEPGVGRNLAPQAAGQKVNPDAKVMAEFEARVKAYSELHRKVEKTIPDLSKEATPEQISQHQMALAQLIARARSGAQFGDIFTKDTRALFRRYLARVFAGREGAQLKAAIMDENPGKLQLHVDARYPEAVPLSTVPAQVLSALPKLPEELEYRFIGDRLVLHDIHAHTIVDLIENAVPK